MSEGKWELRRDNSFMRFVRDAGEEAAEWISEL